MAQFDLGAGDGYQYYSVGEWVVTGSCMCNGHASICALAPGETLASGKVMLKVTTLNENLNGVNTC